MSLFLTVGYWSNGNVTLLTAFFVFAVSTFLLGYESSIDVGDNQPNWVLIFVRFHFQRFPN